MEYNRLMKKSASPQTSLTPAILAYTRSEFAHKVAVTRERKAKLLHIDAMDGKFVDNTCFCSPVAVSKLVSSTPFEAHLMVSRPAKHLAKWAAAGAQQVIVHIEATDDIQTVIAEAKRLKIKLWLAINPGTKITALPLILSGICGILVMGVMPGRGGQRFRPSALKTIANIRQMAPNVPIAVDGGVRANNAEKIISAGATRLIAGSYYFDAA